MGIRSAAAAALGFVLLSSSLGCGTKKGGKIEGSCDEPRNPNDSSKSHTCSDYYDKRLLKDTCTAAGTKVQTTPCDRTGAIGACKGTYGDRWYYGDQLLYPDPQALTKLCGSDPVILPNGSIFTPKSNTAVNADKAKENMAKYGAKAKANLATIATIAKKLPAPTGKPNLEGLSGGALIVHAEDLADPEHPKTLPYRLKSSDNLASCSRLVNGRGDPMDNGDALASCAQRPLLAVVSVTSLKKPAATGTTQSGNTKTTLYSKGRITGDVFLFRLEGGKYLGSFGYTAENVNMPVFATSEKIEADLYEQLASTLTGRAQAAAPGLLSSFSLAKP
jgi:hypothetical protein